MLRQACMATHSSEWALAKAAFDGCHVNFKDGAELGCLAFLRCHVGPFLDFFVIFDKAFVIVDEFLGVFVDEVGVSGVFVVFILACARSEERLRRREERRVP